MKRARRAVVSALFFAGALGVSAQQQPAPEGPPPLPPGSKTGNPTPGTPQPDPPNLADRVTVVGCVETAGNKPAGQSDPNNPSDARFVLAKAERKNAVPPGTGTSSLAASSTSRTYRLRGIDSQLSPFVGARVEVSGEVVSDATVERTNAPVLQVEFVQKIAAKCS
jgi:hypothetical protein